MALSDTERRKMRAAHSIGPAMIDYLEQIGIESLSQLRNADAGDLALQINVMLGRRHINAQGVRALENLVRHAEASLE
jgi:nucleotidyltransferase/DNA polymerase involved in DNA repair